MILSASRRTDIPAFYTPWLINRFKEGYVITRNPFNPNQVSKISLSPELVDCIVFWTKDPGPMLQSLEWLDRYHYYFQFTLTPYDKSIEPSLRDKRDLLETFVTLSKRLGKERVLWRYDPILLRGKYTLAYHKQAFQRMCEKLCRYTETVTFSFIDCYKKIKTDLRALEKEEILELGQFLGKIGREYGLKVRTCCEAVDLSEYGIQKGRCIDPGLIERICGGRLEISRDKNQRPACGCCESIDIGAYDTCLHGCAYCYATQSMETARRNHTAHRWESPLLIGEVTEREKLKERKVKSNIHWQSKLF